MVPQTLGQDLPAGGREAVRAGVRASAPLQHNQNPSERDALSTKHHFSLTKPPPSPALPPQISVPLSTAFGADTEGAQWIVGYLLEKVINNLSVWSSETELSNDTVDLLVTLVEKRER